MALINHAFYGRSPGTCFPTQNGSNVINGLIGAYLQLFQISGAYCQIFIVPVLECDTSVTTAAIQHTFSLTKVSSITLFTTTFHIICAMSSLTIHPPATLLSASSPTKNSFPRGSTTSQQPQPSSVQPKAICTWYALHPVEMEHSKVELKPTQRISFLGFEQKFHILLSHTHLFLPKNCNYP